MKSLDAFRGKSIAIVAIVAILAFMVGSVLHNCINRGRPVTMNGAGKWKKTDGEARWGIVIGGSVPLAKPSEKTSGDKLPLPPGPRIAN